MRKSSRVYTIEWGDCDPAGIVYYPRYFAICDASTVGLFRTAGFEKIELLKRFDAVGFPMVDVRARFSSPSKYGDVIRIVTEVQSLRRSSFDIHHQLFNGDQLALECWETRVWSVRDRDDNDRIRAGRLPDEVRQALSSPEQSLI